MAVKQHTSSFLTHAERDRIAQLQRDVRQYENARKQIDRIEKHYHYGDDIVRLEDQAVRLWQKASTELQDYEKAMDDKYRDKRVVLAERPRFSTHRKDRRPDWYRPKHEKQVSKDSE